MCVGGGEAGALGRQHCNAFCGDSIVAHPLKGAHIPG